MSEKRRDNRNRIFTKESTREQMDVIVLDMWIFMEMKEIYIVGVWTIMILYLKERKWSFL